MSEVVFNPIPGVPGLKPPTSAPEELPGGTGEPEPVQSGETGEGNAALSFKPDTGEAVDDAYFGTSGPSIFSDLDPVELWVKDQVAAKAKKDQNYKTYFSRENLHKTTSELFDEEQSMQESAGFMEKLNWLFDNEYDLGDVDDKFFGAGLSELEGMIKERPERPERPLLERPSELIMGLAGLFSLVLPSGQGARALAMPFQYFLHKNVREEQEGLQRYSDKMQEWQLRFGLKREQVKMIGDRQIAVYEARQKDIAEKMKLRYGAIEKAEDFQITRDKMRQDLNVVLFKADAEERQKFIDNSFSLMTSGKSPEFRALGQEMFSLATGIEIDPIKNYTPAELVDMARAAGLNLDNKFNAETFSARVEGSKADAAQKLFDLKAAPAKLAADLANSYSLVQYRSVQNAISQGRLNLDTLKYANEVQKGDKEADLGTVLKGVGADYAKAEQVVTSDRAKAIAGMNERESKIVEKLEEEGKLKKPGWFGWGKEKVDAHNEQIKAEALAEDSAYQQFKTLFEQTSSDLDSISGKREGIKFLSLDSVRGERVDRLAQTLSKAKTESAYKGMIMEALGNGTVSALEAAKAIGRIKLPGGGDNEGLQRAILNRDAVDLLEDAGVAEQYVNAIMEQLGGGGGGALGVGPFTSPSLAGYGNGRIPREKLKPIDGAPGHFAAPEAASAMSRMIAAARRDGITLRLTDSYRSFAAQVDVKRRKGDMAATPGKSNHGHGVAFDIATGGFDSKVYKWLAANGAKYGFVNPPKLRDGKGVEEPWHWEFYGA